MAGKDAGGITADAEERRVAEGDEPAEAERKVEADGGERQDRHARGERHIERLVQQPGGERQGQQQQRQHKIEKSLAPHGQPCAENRPLGRKARMSAITM